MNNFTRVLIPFAILLCFLHVLGADKYTDQNRPYEFGFTIDGEQHRHEKKDENGIIMGEFGFITADGVYHVTVYATDEQGRFKILSMKNIRVKPYPNGPSEAKQSPQLSLTLLQKEPVPQRPLPLAITSPPPGRVQQSCSHCSLPSTKPPPNNSIAGHINQPGLQVSPPINNPGYSNVQTVPQNYAGQDGSPSNNPNQGFTSQGATSSIGKAPGYQSGGDGGSPSNYPNPGFTSQGATSSIGKAPGYKSGGNSGSPSSYPNQGFTSQGATSSIGKAPGYQSGGNGGSPSNYPNQGFTSQAATSSIGKAPGYQSGGNEGNSYNNYPLDDGITNQKSPESGSHIYSSHSGDVSSQFGQTTQGLQGQPVPAENFNQNVPYRSGDKYSENYGSSLDQTLLESNIGQSYNSQNLQPFGSGDNYSKNRGSNQSQLGSNAGQTYNPQIYNNVDIPPENQFRANKTTLISAQMRVVDRNTDIHHKNPGEKDGLPRGVTESDVMRILYTFNYTVGFHGHHEEGYTNGVKIGYYYVTGRNGVRTRIDYVADENGFRPKITQEVLDLISDDVPKPETEKDEKYGLKSYEFKWLYFPVESKS